MQEKIKTQETLEEAIKEELENHFFSNVSEIKQAEYFINFGAKWQAERMYSEEDLKEAKHIYITSDEEIKEGDWYLNNEHLLKCTELKIRSACKKIILTTDQDLIKDGVQAIDDEFLEWFVKNPSCEEVETVFNNRGITGAEKILKTFGEYKIIIPKEEPKQETLEYGLLQHIKMCLECNNKSQAIRLLEKYGFEKQDGMYSEEELKSAFKVGFNIGYGSPVQELDLKNEYCEIWFEKFKKK